MVEKKTPLVVARHLQQKKQHTKAKKTDQQAKQPSGEYFSVPTQIILIL